ncbi:MAG: PEGA domain-containing protein [Polyangiales bacterium]
MVNPLILVLALASALSWAPTAYAQSPTAGDGSSSEQARRLFKEGIALAKSEQWAEALWAFRQSRDLVPRPSTSYNIANAFYRLDRPVEGLAELDSYEAMAAVRANEAARKRGAALRELLQDVVAEAQVAITPADAEVHVDGRRAKSSGAERVIRMNPGPHTLRFSREGYEPATKEVQAKRGSRTTYAIALRPLTPAPMSVTLPATQLPGTVNPGEAGSAPAAPPADEKKPFAKRPGFWVMIGAIVVVGAGVGVAVALTRKDDSPQCGTTGTCATTQGLTVTSF